MAIEPFVAGGRQTREVGSELAAGRRSTTLQLTFNLQPFSEDQGLTVRIPNHELSLAVMAGESEWLEWFASIKSAVDPF
jgi:hypothetical protein